MNIFTSLFGIFRQRGLVTSIKEGKSLTGFAISAILVSILGGGLYGLAMGAGLGMETAVKDMTKMGLIVFLGLLLSIPIFWIAFRLLGRDEKLAQVAVIPMTLSATVSILLAITSPVVFMLSVLAGFSPDAVYIHIVIVDLALILGLYVAGTMIYHGFSDRKRLITPNVIGFLMMGVIIVVLMSFLSPFLSIRSTFSVGTDRLKDGLGIGVAEKANQALAAAISADRVSYRFQNTNENGDLTQDYKVTRVGNDYLVNVQLHAIPGEIFQKDRSIWIIDDSYYTDFDDGKVKEMERTQLSRLLDPALPPLAFTLSPDFNNASWRAYQSGSSYSVTGINPNRMQVSIALEASTGRLSDFKVGSSDKSLRIETRITEIETATLDRESLKASLSKAIVLGSVDRSDASMKDFVQEDTFFVLRYPNSWFARTWSSNLQQVEFTINCQDSDGCPSMTANVFDLVENKDLQQYAQDLGNSLNLQPQYRDVDFDIKMIGDKRAGILEYLNDETVKGELVTTKHIVYIFVGQLYRYHLDFSAPEVDYQAYRQLFDVMAGQFSYYKELP